jgi:molecular chaperone DnaK
MKLGQAIYEKDQQAAASPGAEAPEGGEAGAAEEEVVDAEYSEVDEDNKG